MVTGSPLGATTTATTVAVTVTAVPFDYVLSNNGPVSITAGSSGTVTISRKLVGSPVTSLARTSFTPLPSGITCTSFSPASVTPTSSGSIIIFLMLLPPPVATLFPYTTLFRSPLGATTTATTVAVTVTAVPFDYVLSNNGPVSITAGSSGTV